MRKLKKVGFLGGKGLATTLTDLGFTLNQVTIIHCLLKMMQLQDALTTKSLPANQNQNHSTSIY